MIYSSIAKKAIMLLLCVIAGYVAVTGMMLLFFSVFSTAVIHPMYYAEINALNCELYASNVVYKNYLIYDRCDIMNLSRPACSGDTFKKMADAIPKENAIQNTGFLVDVVFLSYLNSTVNNECKPAFREDAVSISSGDFTPKIVAPVKQTFSKHMATVMDRSFLNAIEAVVVSWTRDVRNNFEEKCILTAEQCAQKYYDFYSILSDEIVASLKKDLEEKNITYRAAMPIPGQGDSFLILNSFLYASEKNGDWKNPVSNFTYVLLSQTANGFALYTNVRLSQAELTSLSNPFPLAERIMPVVTQVLELAKTMAFAAIKTAYISDTLTGLKETIQELEENYYDDCLNSINCTKDVFQSTVYQGCLTACKEKKLQYVDEKNTEHLKCYSYCSDSYCSENCLKLKMLAKDADKQYASCIPECYGGGKNQ